MVNGRSGFMRGTASTPRSTSVIMRTNTEVGSGATMKPTPEILNVYQHRVKRRLSWILSAVGIPQVPRLSKQFNVFIRRY